MVKMNQACAKYMGKVIYTLFLLTLLESLCSFVFLFPAIKIFSDAQQAQAIGSLQTKIIFFALLFAALVVWLTFQFGFAIMLLRMVRNENTNLGFLFMGFRKFNPAGKVILSFAAIISAVGIATRFITKALFAKLWPVVENAFKTASAEIQAAESAAESAGNAASSATDAAGSILPFAPDEAASIFFESGLFAGIFFLLAFIVLIHFAFVFQLHFDKPSVKVGGLFKESFRMMKGNVFRLIGFALCAGGKNLLIAIVFAVIVSFIPEEKAGLSILVFLFDLAYFINLYTALVKFYFAVPVMYEAVRNEGDELRIENSAQANTDSTQTNTDKNS